MTGKQMIERAEKLEAEAFEESRKGTLAGYRRSRELGTSAGEFRAAAAKADR